MSTLGCGGGGGDDRRVVLLRNVPLPLPSLSRASSALRSSLMAARDCAPFHFGKAAKAPNVSIVGSGAKSGGRGDGAAAARRRLRRTEPRQEHKHHENMALSATVAALKRCGSHSPDWAHPGELLYAPCRIASAVSPNPFGRRTSDKKASNGFRRSNRRLTRYTLPTRTRQSIGSRSIGRGRREGHNGRHESRADKDISRKFLNMLGAFRYLFQFLALMCSGAAAAAAGGAPSLN